jgi:UDP-glucose 4-epimerase
VKVLITGASGLVGRYVVNELAKKHAVEMLDIKAPRRYDLPFHPVNVLEEELVREVVRGFDAVVHLAGIPHPLNDPPEKVFRVNTVGTYNILEACASNGIDKVVFMSSESTLGFAFAAAPMVPLYIPVDEQHPLRPQDPYGLSKVSCEFLCAGFTRRVGMRTICLRAPWIWVPEENELQFYRQLIANYPQWYKNLWAYIHVLDVAQAIRLALTVKLPQRHETLYICADDNWTGQESRKLLKKYYPEVLDIHPDFSGMMSLISNKKAHDALGFSPKYSAKDLLG